MNSRSRILQRPEPHVLQFAKEFEDDSPMLGCFSKRQILASLSSFWWSGSQKQRRHGQEVCSKLLFLVLLKIIWHDWLSDSSELKLAASQFWLWGGHRTCCQCDGCEHSLYACVCECECACAGRVNLMFFLIRSEMLNKNNVTWYVLGYVPHSDRQEWTRRAESFTQQDGSLQTPKPLLEV